MSNQKNDTITLFSGDKMPKAGLGTWKIKPTDTSMAVYSAIKMGYTHIDCAPIYGNEVEVGEGINKAIKEGIVSRSELWITTKLWNTNHKSEHVMPAFMKSLNDLNLEYVDLYLIHFPVSLKYVDPEVCYPPSWANNVETGKMDPDSVPLKETWEAMEKIVETGKAKNIGISNFGCQLTQDLMKYAKVKPAVNQIEFHPYLVQTKLVKYCSSVGIATTAYSPFGGIGYIEISMAGEEDPNVLEDPVIKDIAAKYQKSPAQVVLKWCVQFDSKMSVIAKSSKEERLKENMEISDFTISDEEMNAISSLNKNKRYNDPGFYGEAFFGHFFPIFE